MWGVSSLFAHIWEVSADTILHCYCIDDELEKKGGGSAKNCRDKLTAALEKSEQQNKPRETKELMN